MHIKVYLGIIFLLLDKNKGTRVQRKVCKLLGSP